MKHLIAILLILAPSAALADTAEQVRNRIVMTCSLEGQIGNAIMRGRQLGTPMSEVMETADTPESQQRIFDAYQEPMYSSEDMQQRAAVEFADKIEVECFNRHADELKAAQ